MSNDVVTLNALTRELNRDLASGRIGKIVRPTRAELRIPVRRGADRALIVNLEPMRSRVYVAAPEGGDGSTPDAFCMLLRKYLANKRIERIGLAYSDRIIEIRAVGRNELADEVAIIVFAELIGRYSNLVVADSELTVIDALNRIYPDQNLGRTILPGSKYAPPENNKIKLDRLDLIRPILDSKTATVDGCLAKISGISRETCRELLAAEVPSERLKELLDAAETGDFRPCVHTLNGKPQNCYMLPYAHLAGEFEFHPTLNDAFDAFYSRVKDEELRDAHLRRISKDLSRLSARCARRISDEERRLEESKKADAFLAFGRATLNGMHEISPGQKTYKCVDYSTNAELTVPLDARLSPSRNAQLFFKKYAKLKKSRDSASARLVELRAEKNYLDSIRFESTVASSESEYAQIESELARFSGAGRDKKRDSAPLGPERKISRATLGAMEILYGTTNAQNDFLTFKLARPDDIWMHAKNHHGAHVIVRGAPDERALEKPASIAARFSSGRNELKTEVVWTRKKYVKKPPGGLPGIATYSHYKSILARASDCEKILSGACVSTERE